MHVTKNTLNHLVLMIAFIAVVFVTTSILNFPAEATNYNLADAGSWNIRIDGAVNSLFLGRTSSVVAVDVNNNGLKDIIIGGDSADYNSRSNSGSVWVIYDSLFASLSGTENTIDLADSNNYNLRFDGPSADGFFGVNADAGLIDDDNQTDLVFGVHFAGFNSRLSSGSLYIIYDDLIAGYTGTGNNIDLADTANFSIRFDGAVASDIMGYNSVLTDITGDVSTDIIVTATNAGFNGRTGSGSLYVIDNSIFSGLTGTGNLVDLATSTNFTMRFDGAVASDALGIPKSLLVEDLNADNALDLIINSRATNNGRASSGSTYIIYNEVFASITGTGNTLDLATSTNYSLRYDGVLAGDENFPGPNLTKHVADFDGNGTPEFLFRSSVAHISAAADNGAFFLIDDSLVSAYSGTGNNIDLATTTNYTTRFTGAAANDRLSWMGMFPLDFTNDGNLELLVAADGTDFNSKSASGSVFYFDNALMTSFTGTGNSASVSSASNYTHRFDGPAANTQGIPIAARGITDINGDGKIDMTLYSQIADNNSRTDSGSVFIIYNYPHSINTDAEIFTDSSSVDLTGTLDADNSTTEVSNVQYSINDNDFDAAWASCDPDDGLYDSTNEEFTCTLTGLTEGEYTVYFRSYDILDSYTAQENYVSTALTIDSTVPTGNISINSGATYTNSTSVTLNIAANDNLSGVAEMLISEDSTFTGATYVPYATSKSFTLSSGDGEKTVYIKFKDAAGNESSTASDSIILDTAVEKPEITDLGLITDIPSADELFYYFTSPNPVIQGTAEPGSTIYFQVGDQLFATLVGSDGTFSITLTNLSLGINVITYYVIDAAGDISAVRILTLVIGCDFFPQDLQEIYCPGGEANTQDGIEITDEEELNDIKDDYPDVFPTKLPETGDEDESTSESASRTLRNVILFCCLPLGVLLGGLILLRKGIKSSDEGSNMEV